MRLNSEVTDQNVKTLRANTCLVLECLVGASFMFFGTPAIAQAAKDELEMGDIRIVAIQGKAELMPAGAATWVITQTNQVLQTGDRLRTEDNSRVTLLWCDKSVVPLGPLTQIEILPPNNPHSLPGLQIAKGVLSFFHRDKPGTIRVLTHGANASIEGTEFVMRVSETNGTEQDLLSVLDGKVLFSNAQGAVLLTNDQQAVVEPGTRPMRTAGFIANNLLQWCFYYPGILDLQDLDLTAIEQQTLKQSLDAYRAGDLLAALGKFPVLTQPPSDAVRIYHAALFLSVGEVDQTETELAMLSPSGQTGQHGRLAEALRTLIATVKRQQRPLISQPTLPTEFLADSYYAQSQSKGDESLNAALGLAQQATVLSPQFGFAWARVAELQFSFGRTRPATMALDKSLELSPRNAEALSLKGFLLAAQNNIRDATAWFNRAIATDGALGNAWLGRGLCRIRVGYTADGQRDLLIAAATEPQRSLLRSYLAKGFSNLGQDALANKEIAIALRLDPGDPTGWLYSALIKQQQNQINGAIKDMETSQSLNDNRQLFRSKMLLDQDRAVRSANLATMYSDAGMNDFNNSGAYNVGVREAAKAVTYDYANASAHLFLSDSYNALRDPTGFDLRYDTVWFNELLLANLLAPVGAGRLSQTLSYQEYSKLFESDGMGVASQTFYRSDGQVQQLAGLYGTYKNTSLAADLNYQHNNGVRANNQLDALSGSVTVKQQLTPSDSVLGIAQFLNFHSGDNRQYYNFYSEYDPSFEYAEHQDPTVVGGYQHEWTPGIRTLLLGGRLEDSQRFSTTNASVDAFFTPPPFSGVAPNSEGPVPYTAALSNSLAIYIAEFCQIVQEDKFTLIAGGRWQGGEFSFSDSLTNAEQIGYSQGTRSFSEPFQRLTGYSYLTLEPVDKIWITGGLAYDDMKYPANFRSIPVSPGTDERHILEPKAALVWSPSDWATVRGIYSRSLGGVSLDDSYRLEPTELAGFVQTFRSVVPESIVGSVSGENVQLAGLALDLKFARGTYVGLQWQYLDSNVRQSIGDYLQVGPNTFEPSATPQNLDYHEQSLSASINQLLPEGFVAGMSYIFTYADLKTTYPGIPNIPWPLSDLYNSNPNIQNATYIPEDQSAYLHQIGAYLLWNHPSGLFAQFDAHGYLQQNIGYGGAEPGNDFVQLDIEGGWRFWQRRGQLTVGVLNLAGQNYKLNPLTVYSELPRSRVFFVQLNIVF